MGDPHKGKIIRAAAGACKSRDMHKGLASAPIGAIMTRISIH